MTHNPEIALRDTLIAVTLALTTAFLLPYIAPASLPWLPILLLQIAFLAIPFLFRYSPNSEDSGILRAPRGKDILLAVVITVFLAPFLAIIGSLTGALFPGFEEHTMGINRALLPYGLKIPEIPLFLLLVLLPALAEEFFFRGFLLGRLRRRFSGAALPVVLSAVLFALLHLDIYRAVPLFLYGAVLALFTLGTGSLWPAVASHLTNNALALLSLRLLPADDPAKGLPVSPSPLAVLLIMIPTMIAAVLLLHLLRNRRSV